MRKTVYMRAILYIYIYVDNVLSTHETERERSDDDGL